MAAKKKTNKGTNPPETEKKEEFAPPEFEEMKEEPGAIPQQLGREQLEALRRKLQEKFH